MKEFKLGDTVRINKDSQYYREGDSTNPIELTGKVTQLTGLHIAVLWENNKSNGYVATDLDHFMDNQKIIQQLKSYYFIPNESVAAPIAEWLISLGLRFGSRSTKGANYVWIGSNGEFHFSDSTIASSHSSFEKMYELGLPKIGLDKIEPIKYKVGDRVISADNNIGFDQYANLIGTITCVNGNDLYNYLIQFDKNNTSIWCNVEKFAPEEEKVEVKLTESGKPLKEFPVGSCWTNPKYPQRLINGEPAKYFRVASSHPAYAAYGKYWYTHLSFDKIATLHWEFAETISIGQSNCSFEDAMVPVEMFYKEGLGNLHSEIPCFEKPTREPADVKKLVKESINSGFDWVEQALLSEILSFDGNSAVINTSIKSTKVVTGDLVTKQSVYYF